MRAAAAAAAAACLLLVPADGIAHADPDPDVAAACAALMHQPKDSFVGPNHAALELIHNGMTSDRAYGLVSQLAVYHTDDPAGWRPSQTCFDLWHQGYIK